MKKTILNIALGVMILLSGNDLMGQMARNNPGEYNEETHFGLALQELSRSHLRVFEKRGLQKLTDFFDLLELISDPSLDSEFKEQAMGAAQGLFHNDQSLVTLPVLSGERSTPVSLPDFLEKVRNSQQKLHFEMGDASGSKDFIPEDEQAIKDLTITLSGDHFKGEQKGRITLILLRLQKQFGSEFEYTWEVFLGDIQSVD